MVYHHVWDNKPYPLYNKPFYSSNDKIVCISKVTHDIVKTVAPEVDSVYLPHPKHLTFAKRYWGDNVEDFVVYDYWQ